MLIPRSSRDTSPSSDSEEWVIVPNGDAVSGTGSPSQSPGSSNTSRPRRPSRPPPPTPHRPAASPGRKSRRCQSFYIAMLAHIELATSVNAHSAHFISNPVMWIL